jgi:hypothetical protein
MYQQLLDLAPLAALVVPLVASVLAAGAMRR